jgi:hypothetical protein
MVSAALACGGDDNPACEAFSPCGGDPVGSWRAEATCTTGVSETEEYLAETCPDAPITVVSNIEGTLDVGSDGIYAFDFDITTVVDFTLPPSCLVGISDCEQLDETCSGDVAEGCRCSYQQMEQSMDSEMWTTSGNILDLDGVQWDYCVSGARMTIQTLEQSTGLTYTVVLARD